MPLPPDSDGVSSRNIPNAGPRIALATPTVLVPKNTKPALPALRGFEMFERARTVKRTAKVVSNGPRRVSSSMRE